MRKFLNSVSALALIALTALMFSLPAHAQEAPEGDDQPEELVPQNPCPKWLEGGRLLVIVTSQPDPKQDQFRFGRAFGHRIGEPFPVKVIFYVLPPLKDGDKEIKVDLSSIKNGSLSLIREQDPDFEMVKPPVLTERTETVTLQGGRQVEAQVYEIELLLRTFRPQPALPLVVEFAYATDKRPDGKTFDWKPSASGQFVVTRSPTAPPNGRDLQIGNTEEEPQAVLALPVPLMVFGGVLILLPVCIVLVRLGRKLLPDSKLDADELAWREFDRAIADAKKHGWQQRHYQQIVATLKRFLKIDSVTIQEIQARASEFLDNGILVPLLTRLEVDVLYRGGSLDDEEKRELPRTLERLVPRP